MTQARLMPPVDEIEVIIDGNENEWMTDEEIAVENFLNESRSAGGEGFIIVKKINDPNNAHSTLTHCDQFPVDKYDFNSLHGVIKKRWGAGDFRVLCFASGKNGKRQLKQNKLISIAEELEPKKNGDNSVIGDLMAELRAMRSELTKPKGGDDFMQNLAMYATIMEKMRPPASNPMQDFLTTFKVFQELGMLPGSAKEEEINPMWASLAQALPTLISGAMENKQRAPVIHPHPKKPQPKQDQKNSMISYYLKQLEEYANNNVSSESVADLIVEKAPDFDMLMTIVSRPDFITHHTSSGFWAKSEYREWLNDVREWLLAHDGKPSKYSDQFSDTAEPLDSGSLDIDDNSVNENEV